MPLAEHTRAASSDMTWGTTDYRNQGRGYGRANDEETIFVGPASGIDVAEGYTWCWVVSYRGERRSGACMTREQAEAEAASVLELLRDRSHE
jgi:hypothetical protein